MDAWLHGRNEINALFLNRVHPLILIIMFGNLLIAAGVNTVLYFACPFSALSVLICVICGLKTKIRVNSCNSWAIF